MICIYLYGIFIQDTYYFYKNTNINMFIRSYDFFDEASDACSGRSRGSSWVTWTHSKSTPVAFLWDLLNDSVSQGTQVAFLLRKCTFLQPTLYDFSIFVAFWDHEINVKVECLPERKRRDWECSLSGMVWSPCSGQTRKWEWQAGKRRVKMILWSNWTKLAPCLQKCIRLLAFS